MLKFINPDKKRFYNIYFGKDMFSEFTMTICHGGIGHRLGGAIRHYSFKSELELQLRLRGLIRRRRQRGYNLVCGSL